LPETKTTDEEKPKHRKLFDHTNRSSVASESSGSKSVLMQNHGIIIQFLYRAKMRVLFGGMEKTFMCDNEEFSADFFSCLCFCFI